MTDTQVTQGRTGFVASDVHTNDDGRGIQIIEKPELLAAFTVSGWGTALPQQRITNEDMSYFLDTSDEWINARTGIRERRVSGPGESTGQLALEAATAALAHAKVHPGELDAVIVATSTPEHPIPSTAAEVSAALGVTGGSFDLNAACAGFVYGMAIAGGMLETRLANTVLLIGADTLSRFVDPTDRTTAVLFGDGAGAVVLQRDESRRGGLLACDLVGDPESADLLVIPAGGSALPASHETVAAGSHYIRMDGREVFRRAVRSVTESVHRTLGQAGCTADDVDLFIPHQANARIIDAVLERTGIPAERTVQTVARHGNTSSASVPLALAEVADAHAPRDGSLVLTSGFGAGLTVGTSLLRWRVSSR